MKKIKKIGILMLVLALLASCFSGCDIWEASKPVTLNMWHVYGEQSDSPMDLLVDEFNSTVGKEQGIVINVTSNTNAHSIGSALVDSMAGKSGAKAMPDLFFVHSSDAKRLGAENLVDFRDYFDKDEISQYVDAFVDEGTIDGRLVAFPVAKSTNMLFINGSMFERFSKDTGVTYEHLATWDGFFDVSEKFYNWSGGKPFCGMDYILRSVELSFMAKNPNASLFAKDSLYDFDNANFKAEWDRFVQALVLRQQFYITTTQLLIRTTPKKI